MLHENCLPADNSHEISYLNFSKIRKDVAKFVVCCSHDWRFKGERTIRTTVLALVTLYARAVLKKSDSLISDSG